MCRVIEDASELSHPILQAFFAYWDRLRRGRAWPQRHDVDPLDIEPVILPHIVLIDSVPELGDFRYRLVGTGVVERTGSELRGMLVTESAAEAADALCEAMRLVVGDGKPRHVAHGYAGPVDGYRAVERVIAPLSRQGAGIDMLIGAAAFHRCPPEEIDLSGPVFDLPNGHGTK
jgi:hypothetical protein